MIYLKQKQFKPAVILLSILFSPAIIVMLITTIAFYKLELLIILLSLVIIYLLLLLFFLKVSYSKKNYLELGRDNMKIVYPNINKGENELDINYSEINSFDYYKITSFKGWLILTSFVLPQCVFITYNNNGNEITELMGHLDYEYIKNLASEKKIKFIEH